MSGFGVAEATRPVFARHETFHPRHGWFRKAVVGVRDSDQIFTADDATVRLGVGKNMVRAIRFWATAAKVIEPFPNPEHPRVPRYVESNLSRALFSEDGWDPWLESTASLWLLHWMMMRPPSILPVWWIALNDFQSVEFSGDDLARYATEAVAGIEAWSEVAASSVKKDVDCFLRTYSGASGREVIDDGIDCPFRSLGLLAAVPGERGTYRFLVGSKPTLPDEIVAFACLDFVGHQAGMRTATLTRLTVDPGSPGRIFRLDEDAIYEALLRLQERGLPLSVAAVGGINQFVWTGVPDELAWYVLTGYFRTVSGSEREAVVPGANKSRSGRQRPASLSVEDLDARIASATSVIQRLKLIQRRKDLSIGAAQ
jgi:uncharacterized small protein (DUF1192 family)